MMKASRRAVPIKRTGKVVSVPVGEGMIGRVVNALGQPIDGKGPIEAADYRAIESPAPGILDRQRCQAACCRPASRPSTRMIPIGRGQRELIIGDRQTGKTVIATDTIINQKGKDVLCIYVAIGQKRSTVAHAGRRISTQSGAMDVHHRRLRYRVRAGASAVYRPLRRLRHG